MRTGNICRNCGLDDKEFYNGLVSCKNCGGLIFDTSTNEEANK